jgi:hypothetical protein
MRRAGVIGPLLLPSEDQNMKELLDELRQTLKSGRYKQGLANMDEKISFGNCDPIVRLMFQFMLGRTPAELHELAEFHELFADMLE